MATISHDKDDHALFFSEEITRSLSMVFDAEPNYKKQG